MNPEPSAAPNPSLHLGVGWGGDPPSKGFDERSFKTDSPGKIITNVCAIVFEILDTGGGRFVEPVVCNDIGMQHMLRPGESLRHDVTFDGTGWIASDGDPGPGPGDHIVRAGVSLAFRSPSAPVGLRVRAAAP